jgi:hypothetical protein
VLTRLLASCSVEEFDLFKEYIKMGDEAKNMLPNEAAALETST